MCENEWRAEYCPESEMVYCSNPYECATCDGAWNCEDIYNISVEVMAAYDTNGDGQINAGDDIDETHLYYITNDCDFDGNETVDACEIHTCIVMIENEWRDEYCPDYGHLYCE